MPPAVMGVGDQESQGVVLVESKGPLRHFVGRIDHRILDYAALRHAILFVQSIEFAQK